MRNSVKSYFLNLSIFNKVFYGIILIVFIIITIFSTISYLYLHNKRGAEAMENTVGLVKNINKGFQDGLDQIDRIIMLIYADTSGSGSDLSIEDVLSTSDYKSLQEEYAALKVTKEFFQRLLFLRKDFNSIYIYVSKNKTFSYSVNGRNKLNYSPVEEEWFNKTIAAGGRTVISAPHLPYQLNYHKEVVSFSRLLEDPAKIDSDVKTVVLIDLTLDTIHNIIDKANLGKTTGVMFLDNTGKLIYSNNIQSRQKDLSKDTLDIVLKSKEGNFTTRLANEKYLVAFNTSDITGWKLLTLTPYSEVSKDDTKLILFSLFLMLLALMITTLISFIFSRAVVKPIKRLQKGMLKVKAGNFDTQLENTSNDELGQLVSSFNSMIFTIKKLIVEKYEERIARNDAEFKYLQAQINPHFIYNMLQTISSMAVVKKVPEISNVSKGLAKILRYSVNTKNKIITIKEEMEYLICYLEIQKIRFKDFLNYEVEMAEEVYDIGIIKLVFQPIVENAISHGIEPKGENGMIKIKVQRVQGDINIVISDNGIGMTQEEVDQLMLKINLMDEDEIQPYSLSDNNNIGLRNINFRIKIVYGEEYGLKVESQKGEGTRVYVKIPAERVLEGGRDGKSAYRG